MTLRICSWLSTGTRQAADIGLLLERKRGSDPAAKASFPIVSALGRLAVSGSFRKRVRLVAVTSARLAHAAAVQPRSSMTDLSQRWRDSLICCIGQTPVVRKPAAP